VNLYAYAGNDPVNFSDPFGLDPSDLAFMIAQIAKALDKDPGDVKVALQSESGLTLPKGTTFQLTSDVGLAAGKNSVMRLSADQGTLTGKGLNFTAQGKHGTLNNIEMKFNKPGDPTTVEFSGKTARVVPVSGSMSFARGVQNGATECQIKAAAVTVHRCE